MTFYIKACRVHVSFYFAAVVAFMLAGDKDSAAFVSFLSVLLHESGHIMMYFFFHELPFDLEFGIFGIRLSGKSAVSLSYRQEFITALSGPAMNYILSLLLLCIMIVFNVPALLNGAVINFFLGFLNTLPIDPLDGGRCLYYLLAQKKGADFAEKTVNLCSAVFLFPLMAFGFYLALVSKSNPTLLFMSVYLSVLLVKRCRQ